MTRKRFEELWTNLHFTDNRVALARTDSNFDRGYKIRPVSIHYNKNFQVAIEASEFKCIDEHIVKSKGQNRLHIFALRSDLASPSTFDVDVDLFTGYIYRSLSQSQLKMT